MAAKSGGAQSSGGGFGKWIIISIAAYFAAASGLLPEPIKQMIIGIGQMVRGIG